MEGLILFLRFWAWAAITAYAVVAIVAVKKATERRYSEAEIEKAADLFATALCRVAFAATLLYFTW